MSLVRIFNTYEPVISLVRDLAPALRDAGLSTELVISRSEYRPGRTGLAESLSAVGGRVVFMPSWRGGVLSRLGKLFVSINYALSAGVYALFSRRSDVNVFLTQPPLFFAWARVLKAVRRQPYIVVLMDMYPDALVVNGAVREGSIVARVLGKSARFGLSGADRVIVIGRCMRQRVIEVGIEPESIRYVPNWADETKIYPVEESANAIRKEMNLGSQFVVLYSGNMGMGHRFEDILEVARRFSGEPGIKFVFIGGGARRGEIESFVARHRLDNVLLRNFVRPDMMPEAQSLGDVHFVTLRREFEGIMVPSKVYGALAAGRPVIYQGGEGAEIARMISEDRVGSVVQEGDVDHLYDVVLDYFRNKSETRQQGKRALRLAHGKYSKEHALSAYVDTIKSVLGMSSQGQEEGEAPYGR